MAKTNIEWTDYSWNFVTGCSKVSAGCKNCYAETMAKRFWRKKFPNGYGGYESKIIRKFTDVQIDESKMELPLHLKKPKMIFVNSMSDLFHEKVSFEIIDRAWDVMAITPQHTYQILTKRPDRALEYFKWFGKNVKDAGLDSIPSQSENILDYVGILPNVWLGVSVEDQKTADERIPLLLQIPAAVKWLSIEPLLEPLALELESINWVVIGAESGHKRRECKIVWVEHIIKQCKTVGNYIPVFVKQLQINGKVVKDISLFPKHLQIREWPKV